MNRRTAMQIARILLAVTAIVVSIHAVIAQPGARKEREISAAWCAQQGGRPEYVLPDRTRIDCLTATHAVEVEHAPKWKQAIGQSLHYARMTERRAGIVIILGDPSQVRYLDALSATIEDWQLPIDTWTIDD